MIGVSLDGGRRTTAIRYDPVTPDPTHARVVLAHGAGAGQQHPFIVNAARRLAAAGFEVVTFNFPYLEEKRRVPDRPAALEACFRRVVEAAREGDAASRPLFIGGKSMGGRIATHLAAQGASIAGVFALGYPLHPPGKPQQLRSAHLPDITVPVLIVQGERDPFGTPSELAPAVAAMQAPVTLEVAVGGDHSLGRPRQPASDRDDWLAAVIAAWIRRVYSA